MLITDMYQSPEVGIYVPRPYVKRQFPLVRYGSKTIFELMDIFLPDAGEGPFPAVIDIHGGGYFYGSRASVRMEPVLELIHRGYVVVTLDYTLSPYGKFPLQVQEIKAAVRYLRAHAELYHINPDRIGLWGLSAGAHLAVLAAVSTGVKELDDPDMGNAEYPDTVQAVVDLYGPVDLAIGDADEHEDPSGTMSAMLFGKPLCQAPELLRLSNPCHFIHDRIPPVFIQHGDSDHLVNVQNSRLLYNRIVQIAGEGRGYFQILKGADHADPLFRTEENNRIIYEFLDRYLTE